MSLASQVVYALLDGLLTDPVFDPDDEPRRYAYQALSKQFTVKYALTGDRRDFLWADTAVSEEEAVEKWKQWLREQGFLSQVFTYSVYPEGTYTPMVGDREDRA